MSEYRKNTGFKRTRIQVIVFLMMTALLLTAAGACASAEEQNGGRITLSDEGVQSDAIGATVEGSVVTILLPGEYTFSGSLSNGQIIVDCDYDDDVILILDGAEIYCEDSAAIFVKQSKNRTYLRLAPSTKNTLSGGKKYEVNDKSEPNGVIFSSDDLVIDGGGALTVKALFRDGIVSKDDLTLKGVNLTVDAVYNGIRGKDSVEIDSCTLVVKAGNDGIKSTNDTDSSRGYIDIEDSVLDISCEDEPLSAVTRIRVGGGIINMSIAQD